LKQEFPFKKGLPTPKQNPKMEDLKKKIEAVLFCVPEGMHVKTLSRKIGVGSIGQVKKILEKMQEEFFNRGINLVEENKKWKFKVRGEYSDLVKEAAIPEMNKAVLQTLAYIAWKKEITQNEVAKFRSNKAYNHIKKLKKRGFVESKKKGKTELVFPTKKFYEYFKISQDQELTPEALEGLENKA